MHASLRVVALPAAHELAAIKVLSTPSTGIPRLVGRLPPSFCPVVALPPLTFASALLVLPVPCSWGDWWVPNPT